MEETADRLAPVSYLFGSPQPAEADTAPDAAGTRGAQGTAPLRAAGRAAVSFRDIHDDVAAWNDSWGDDVAGEQQVDLDLERVSMKALGRRALSQREVERMLRDHGADETAVAGEIDRLTRVGLLDDEALAQTLVGTLQERKGLGRTAIAAELTKRLLAPAAIEYALELVDTGDELARARELARKRAAQLSGLDRDAAVRRLSGYLARRGYSGSAVRAAVEQALPLKPRSSVRFR